MFLQKLDDQFPGRVRKLLVALVTAISLTLLAVPSPILAQGEQPTSLKNVVVSVYPEYDDLLQLGYPTVLVMLEGEVVNTDIPVTIRFLVPSDAVMYSAGSGPRSQYQGGPPNRKSSDIVGWDEISYELKTKYFVVEYYAPIVGQPDKIISYDFRPLYPVNDLTAIVQEPKRSTNFTVSPQGLITTDSEGFRVHTYSYTNISLDAPLHFDVSYTKADSRPSLSSNGNTGSPNTITIMVVLGIIVVLTGAFILVSRLRSKPQPSTTRTQRRQAARASRRGQISKSKYCSNCGKTIESSYHFCRYCGNELD